jgi:hypothetical protein
MAEDRISRRFSPFLAILRESLLVIVGHDENDIRPLI